MLDLDSTNRQPLSMNKNLQHQLYPEVALGLKFVNAK